MHYSKCFNYNYMDIVGYETCDKLIWTLCEGCRNEIQPEKKVFQKVI